MPLRVGNLSCDRWLFRYAALTLLIAALITLRDISVLVLPELRFEDGREFFAFFYQHHSLASIGHYYAGYIALLTNIISYLVTSLPARLIPYAFTVIPLLFAGMVCSLFSLPSYRIYVSSDGMRAAACIVFALAPTFHLEMNLALAYMIWNCLFGLVLLLLVSPPRRLLVKAAWFVAINIFIFSNPASIALLPLLLYRMLIEKNSRRLYIFFIIGLMTYLAFGIQRHSTSSLGIVNHSMNIIAAAMATIKIFFEQAYKALFGTLVSVHSNQLSFLAFVLLSTWIVVALFSVCDRSMRLRICFLLLISYCLIFISVIGRGASYVGQIHAHMRYMYVPSMLTYIILFILAERFVCPSATFGHGDGLSALTHSSQQPAQTNYLSRYSFLVNRREILASLVIIFFYFSLNVEMGYYNINSLGLDQRKGSYAGDVKNGLVVRDFFVKLAQSEDVLCASATKLAKNPLLAQKKGNDWPFHVVPRCRS